MVIHEVKGKSGSRAIKRRGRRARRARREMMAKMRPPDARPTRLQG
jgi:hypothetical protein